MRQTPAGCRLESVEDAACRAWLNHAAAGGPTPDGDYDLRWLLAHCDNGVVWGRRSPDGWRLSVEPFPTVSPRLGAENVQQMRLFGPQSELLVWRADDRFRGRLLTHDPDGVEPALDPEMQDYLLIGDRVFQSTRDGFTVVGDGRGSRHAVPLIFPESEFPVQPRRHPLRLRVWHYFSADEESGLVRVVASRLADVWMVTEENS